jgi:hypothetical protein
MTAFGYCLLYRVLMLSPALWLGLLPSADQVDADRALNSIGQPRWYNRSEDRYAPPRVNPEPDNSIRKQGWLASEVSASSKKKRPFSDFNWGPWNFGNWGSASDLFSAVVLTVLAVLIAVSLALLIFYSLRNYVPSRFRQSSPPGAIEIDPSRVVDLPFEAQQSSYQNPLEQAEAFMQAGRYQEAVVYLYAYQLLALDRSRKIELHKGKTNRMYLRELHAEAQLQSIVQQTMLLFEAVFFGKHEIDRDSFEACWQLLPEFHRILAPAGVALPAKNSEVVPA